MRQHALGGRNAALAEVDRDPQGAGQVMSDERVLPVYPPVRLLWAAAVADVVGVALAVVGGFRANVAGYGLSALVAIGFLAAFPRDTAAPAPTRPGPTTSVEIG